ncbi:ATP-binding cassette domain-containing protein [Scytonema sp. UIC 10036]|uniref:ABC transporter transmembrane domain-containing protein n=1 Tax=Scytonema sp. UIC 10036 TaxID=2304196 RepID=UPI0012DA632E|nr:ATP-binding cassette domain-containing protein [Scytonema sp. UIC 10036]
MNKPLLHRKVKFKAGDPPPAQPRLKVLGRLLGYVTRYALEVAAVIALLLLSTVLNLLIPYWLGVGLNNLSSTPDLRVITQLAIGIAIAAICSSGTMLWQTLMLNRVVQRALYRLRQDLFEQMQTLSLNFFDRQPIGDLMSRVTNDTDAVAQFFRNSLNSVVSETLQLVFLVLAMFLLNWKLAIATLTIAPLIVLFLGFISQIAGPVFANLQQQIGELNGLLEETVSGQKVVIAYGRQEEAIATFEDISHLVRVAGVKARLLALVSGPVTLVLTNLDVALVALVGGLLTLRGEANVGVVATFLQYTRQFSIPIASLANNLDTLLAASAAAERIFSILDERPAIVDQPNAPEMPPIQGHVVARDVDFSYIQGRPILKHNSFEARPGEKIGLCGPTGAGKSTIINLITRYYDLDGGEILIDGHNIATVQQDSLRRQIGIVLQEAFLFSDTVMNNLRYARLDATEHDCIEATKQANAHEFILHLPDGYNTMLTERGSNLSQGQRQLLTIARMMVQNPRMVILDEATSNVDTRTEQKIQEALDRLMQGRTSFVIAHRLSTIRNADRILVLNAGEIIETGSHDELMQKQGFYYDLFMSQFKGKR